MTKEILYMGEKILVSDDGTIVWNNKVRKHNLNKDGYPVVSISTSKGWRCPAVHRLVAIAFIPNPRNLPEVDHINFDRSDYSVENLAWITREENVRRSVCNKPNTTGQNNPNYGNKKLSLFYKEHPDVAKKNNQDLVSKMAATFMANIHLRRCNDHPVREYMTGETPAVEALRILYKDDDMI